MGNSILLAATALLFVFGLRLMKKLDAFLGMNQNACAQSGCSILRIAFENPVMMESVSCLLEDFSKKNPSCELYFFSGEVEDLLMKVERHEIDFAIIGVLSASKSAVRFNSIQIPRKQGIVIPAAATLPIIPIPTEENDLEVVWSKENRRQEETLFIKQIKKSKAI